MFDIESEFRNGNQQGRIQDFRKGWGGGGGGGGGELRVTVKY